MTQEFQKLRGLKDVTSAAVEQGASAVEQVHLQTAGRVFSVLKQIPAIAQPAAIVETIHNTVVATSYGAVRSVTRGVSATLDTALDAVDRKENAGATASEQS